MVARREETQAQEVDSVRSTEADGRKHGSSPQITEMTHIPKDAPSRQDEPTHSEDGVDLTLIRWMLSLTPAERLEVLENNVRSILRLRGEAET